MKRLCPTNNCTIAVVGHSLGGALATVAAVELMRWNVSSKIELYSFGAPRVGTYS
jgi:predicted lipase